MSILLGIAIVVGIIIYAINCLVFGAMIYFWVEDNIKLWKWTKVPVFLAACVVWPLVMAIIGVFYVVLVIPVFAFFIIGQALTQVPITTTPRVTTG